MKLAINKEEGRILEDGFRYSLFPKVMDNLIESAMLQEMGYILIEVTDEKGNQLLKQARLALMHQVEISILTEESLKPKITICAFCAEEILEIHRCQVEAHE
jgi:hypothetical protein